MKTRKILYAEDGYILTNGELYGKQIFLADSENEADWHEITDAEYAEICKAQERDAE